MDPLQKDKPKAGESVYGQHNVALGDELYFAHDQHGALHGPVDAVGADGVLVRHEHGDKKGRFEVPWDKLLGHRSRTARRLSIVDQGDDGAIALDQDGRRVFVRGSRESFGGGRLTKSEMIDAVRDALAGQRFPDVPLQHDGALAVAAAIQSLADAMRDQVAADAEARREQDIAREAADMRVQQQFGAMMQAFTSALQAVTSQAAGDRESVFGMLAQVVASQGAGDGVTG
jgi:hypothetical protein